MQRQCALLESLVEEREGEWVVEKGRSPRRGRCRRESEKELGLALLAEALTNEKIKQ